MDTGSMDTGSMDAGSKDASPKEALSPPACGVAGRTSIGACRACHVAIKAPPAGGEALLPAVSLEECT
jgi:hypothetical protein